MELYVYPGREVYACSKCNRKTVPETFKNFRPICSLCVSTLQLKLKCSAAQINNAPTGVCLREIQQSSILARKLAVLDLLKDGPVRTAEIANFLNIERRGTVLDILHLMESARDIISFQRTRLSHIWWALPSDEETLYRVAKRREDSVVFNR